VKTSLLLIGLLSLFAIPAQVRAAAPAPVQTPPPGVMPSVDDLLKVVDKATTDPEQQEPTEWSSPIRLVILFTLLAVLPSLLAMMTSFTRIVIVLGFVRQALSTQNIPPNIAIMGLALFLTLFTMAPTFTQIQAEAIGPYLAGTIGMEQAAVVAGGRMKGFMLRQTRPSDLTLFVNMAGIEPPAEAAELPLHIVTPAFIISEFRTAFEIGCLMFIPFLLLDLVIAGVLLSAGMMMLPPMMISLPFKLILFILVDGWGILAQGLSLSFR
jgi:flagellar biosynthetic protein FliP